MCQFRCTLAGYEQTADALTSAACFGVIALVPSRWGALHGTNLSGQLTC